MCIQIHTYTIYFTHTYILYLYVKLIAFILDLKKIQSQMKVKSVRLPAIYESHTITCQLSN